MNMAQWKMIKPNLKSLQKQMKESLFTQYANVRSNIVATQLMAQTEPWICFSVLVLNHVCRWCVFLSGELCPSTCVSHLWMGVLRHHHAVLRDICLWVRQHVRGHHGSAGKRRDPGTRWERTQSRRTGRTHTATSTPAWKHVHTLACQKHPDVT